MVFIPASAWHPAEFRVKCGVVHIRLRYPSREAIRIGDVLTGVRCSPAAPAYFSSQAI